MLNFISNYLFFNFDTNKNYVYSLSFQVLVVFITYFFPRARGNQLPWHIFGRMTTYVMGLIIAKIGLLQRFLFLGLRANQEGLIVSFTDLLLILFVVSICLALLHLEGLINFDICRDTNLSFSYVFTKRGHPMVFLPLITHMVRLRPRSHLYNFYATVTKKKTSHPHIEVLGEIDTND